MLSGVYLLTFRVGDRFFRYVGASQDMVGRWRSHASQIRQLKHSNPHIREILRDQAWRYATFEVLEECDLEALRDCEARAINEIDPELNVTRYRDGKAVLANATREKMSVARKQSHARPEVKAQVIASARHPLRRAAASLHMRSQNAKRRGDIAEFDRLVAERDAVLKEYHAQKAEVRHGA